MILAFVSTYIFTISVFFIWILHSPTSGKNAQNIQNTLSYLMAKKMVNHVLFCQFKGMLKMYFFLTEYAKEWLILNKMASR